MVFVGFSCKPDNVVYDLRGVKSEPWYEPIPFGMAYIEQGSFRMGPSGEVVNEGLELKHTVSVAAFWMDETEITNGEYLQYIKWVLDSTAAQKTIDRELDYYKLTDKKGNIVEPTCIDWDKTAQIWTDKNSEVRDALEPMYYQGKDKLKLAPEIDVRQLAYSYVWIDYEKAAQREYSFDYETQQYKDGASRNELFAHLKSVPVYPDTLVWIRDFTYSYNEPWALTYFHHPAFRDYPLVGVNWDQANAFCHWRTQYRAAYLATEKIAMIHPYRLPTEAEWEWAARGGKANNNFPWGGYYTSNEHGCYKANFKPKRGNYVADSRNSARTNKVGTYDPNGFGLYDMAGNVAEWTITAYDPGSQPLVNDLNPNFQYNASPEDPSAMKRKVVRGGSWKDVAYMSQVWYRDFEYQDTTRCYIGFRCVMNAIADNEKRNKR